MISFKKIEEQDIPRLYEMALRAFQPDFEMYGVYPPLLVTDTKSFLHTHLTGRIILADGIEIGMVFAAAVGKKGDLGAIFIDPEHQKNGYGRQVMSAVEEMYPEATEWRLDTPSRNYHLHKFYESLGYVKTGEIKDSPSGMVTFVYEKTIQ